MVGQHHWQQMYGTKYIIENLVVQDVINRLAQRPPGARNQGPDNSLFQELTDATVVAVGKSDYGFAIKLFHECWPHVIDYQNRANCEVHKGAIAFNVAVAYLRANDFSAAMHYFELAQYETRQTTGINDWGIYTTGLFDQNFWNVLDLFEKQSPCTKYRDFWNVPFTGTAAKQDWAALSDHSKLPYILTNAERISFRRLKPQPGWPTSDSVSVSNWNLIADLARILETELGQRGMAAGGLRSGVLSAVPNTPIVGFRTEVNALHAAMPVNSPLEYNTHFLSMRAAVEDPSRTLHQRIAAAAFLAGNTRNQVQHQVETSMILYTDRSAAEFAIETLLSLCHLQGWLP